MPSPKHPNFSFRHYQVSLPETTPGTETSSLSRLRGVLVVFIEDGSKGSVVHVLVVRLSAFKLSASRPFGLALSCWSGVLGVGRDWFGLLFNFRGLRAKKCCASFGGAKLGGFASRRCVSTSPGPGS